MTRPRMLALDTEDDSKGTVGIINFYDGERHTTFKGEPPVIRHRAWNWLNQQAPAHVWACNMEYDLINLCGPWVGRMATIQYIKSGGFLRATWVDAPITFYDTIRHWPMSVKQMGVKIELPKLDVDTDGDGFMSVPYCQRDTEIVWKFVEAMLARYDAMDLDLKATLPSMALQLFKKHHYGRPFPSVPDYERAFFRQGYYGGRVEVYRFKPIAGAINHYDVNSLFPTVMKSGTFPDLHHDFTRTTKPDWSQEGMADVTLTVPVTRYPCLPMRSPGNELVYPFGKLHGTWAYPEIRQAIQDGARVHQVHEAIQYRPAKSPFASFVDFCYEKRLQAAKGSLDDVYWKLMMNSLYGKFGQNDGLEVITNDRLRALTTSAGHANVLWAAYVTSLARVRLLSELRRCTDCYYTDTDSLFTPNVLPTGTGLGELKQEGSYMIVEFMGNKLYTFTADGPHGSCKQKGPHNHVKAKGVPGEGSRQPEAARDFLRNGRCIYRRPTRLKESRRTGTANSWEYVEKVRDDFYTKRKVLRDGRTEPWLWTEYLTFKEQQRGEGLPRFR